MHGDDQTSENPAPPAGAPRTDLSWLLDELVARTDQVRPVPEIVTDRFRLVEAPLPRARSQQMEQPVGWLVQP